MLPQQTLGGVSSLWGDSRTRCRSFLLQQGGDVDVPANGLPVKAAGEQVAGGVVFTPGGAAHHTPVTLKHDRQHSSCSTPRTETREVMTTEWSARSQSEAPTDLSVASWESSQSHPGHVEQPDLPIVVRKSDDSLVHRHADPGPDNSEKNRKFSHLRI